MLATTFINLLPAGQLDGGHIVYALFGRAHKWVTYVFLLALIVMGKYWGGWWLWAGMIFFFARSHPPIYDQTPIGSGRVYGSALWRSWYSCSASLSRPWMFSRAEQPMKISATIVAFNEEHNIARAIASLRLGECADEIVVVDSGSTDRTREIAASLGARVA